MKRLGEELKDVLLWSASWDATYRFAEVFVMLAYFFNSRGRRRKRIIDMRLLKGSLTGPETAGAGDPKESALRRWTGGVGL